MKPSNEPMIAASQKPGFTPGPWKCKRENDGLCALRISGDGFIIADVFFQSTYQFAPDADQCRANARLISSAPELFEALAQVKGILDECLDSNCFGYENGIRCLKVTLAALSKARGE
jgi:hypothetical protein